MLQSHVARSGQKMKQLALIEPSGAGISLPHARSGNVFSEGGAAERAVNHRVVKMFALNWATLKILIYNLIITSEFTSSTKGQV